MKIQLWALRTRQTLEPLSFLEQILPGSQLFLAEHPCLGAILCPSSSPAQAPGSCWRNLPLDVQCTPGRQILKTQNCSSSPVPRRRSCEPRPVAQSAHGAQQHTRCGPRCTCCSPPAWAWRAPFRGRRPRRTPWRATGPPPPRGSAPRRTASRPLNVSAGRSVGSAATTASSARATGAGYVFCSLPHAVSCRAAHAS